MTTRESAMQNTSSMTTLTDPWATKPIFSTRSPAQSAARLTTLRDTLTKALTALRRAVDTERSPKVIARKREVVRSLLAEAQAEEAITREELAAISSLESPIATTAPLAPEAYSATPSVASGTSPLI